MQQPRYSWPLPALIHWEVKARGTSMKDVGGAGFAGGSPPFLGQLMMSTTTKQRKVGFIQNTARRHRRGG